MSIFKLTNKTGYKSPFDNWTQKWETQRMLEREEASSKKPQANPKSNPQKSEHPETFQPNEDCYQEYFKSMPGVFAFRFGNSEMEPFITTKNLSVGAKEMDSPYTTDFSVNAQFFNLSVNLGITYQRGQNLGGESQPDWYYIAQDISLRYTFGLGDPPQGSWNAVGGGRNLIIDGLPYGDKNIYSEGAPSGLPETGKVSDVNRKYLIQKSAAYFSKQDSKTKGKTILAHNSTTDQIAIYSQEDGSDGFTLTEVRNMLLDNGFDNALSFDGSDSSLLVKDHRKLVDNGFMKDALATSGVTFRLFCQ